MHNVPENPEGDGDSKREPVLIVDCFGWYLKRD